MVALQILSKCIASGNIDIIENNMLTEEHFVGYADEYRFIVEHFKKYGNTPDKATFISKFPAIELVDVSESDRYLVDTIREEYLFTQSVPIVQKIAELLNTDANSAVEYMLSATKQLQPNYGLQGVDIIANVIQRYEEYKERKNNQDKWFFASGFAELDEVIHGIQRTEEFILIVARTNMGKSWVLEKIIEHIWEQGNNVGYFSPEMGASSIGYRFDTLYRHFDNTALVWGKDSISEDEYAEYIEKLKDNKHKFIVSTPADFGNRVTITKLKNWVKQYDLKAIAIDGITYLTDERGKKGDNKTTSLTNISEDLMSLSIELNIPVLAVVQANRGGVTDKDNKDVPELENIRDSDGMSFNATKILSLKQDADKNLILQVKKQRNGIVGTKIAYRCNFNDGTFDNIPVSEESASRERRTTERPANEIKQLSKEDIF